MGILAGIERLCEAALEAAPAAKAEPLDLVRAIENEIRRSRRAFVNDRTYVPHGITVHFYTPGGARAEEYQALFDSDEFRDYLVEHIRQRGYRLAGDVRFAIRCHCEPRPEFRRRPCFVEFSWPPASDVGGKPAAPAMPQPRAANPIALRPIPDAAQNRITGGRVRLRAARPTIWAALVMVLSACGMAIVWKKALPWPHPDAPAFAQAAAPPPRSAESGLAQRLEQSAEEWARILALEESPRGSYEDRIDALRSFLQSYPDALQAKAAAERLSFWQDEREAYLAAEHLERAPAARMSEILAGWQAFLENERSALSREHARERIRFWSERLANYAGYAEFTIHSARGLPAKDSGILDAEAADPYFVLLDGDRILHRSRTVFDSSAPVWNESSRIWIGPDRVPVLEIRDQDIFGYDQLLRRPLAPLPPDGRFRLVEGDVVVELEIRRDR